MTDTNPPTLRKGPKPATFALCAVLLVGCDDAMADYLQTAEGRSACASAGGEVLAARHGGGFQDRCFRYIRIDTARAVVEDTTGGRR